MSAGDKRPVLVDFTEGDARSLYLRTGLADGTTEDGTPFEIALSGSAIILSLGSFTDDDRVVDLLRVEDLVKAWLESRGKA